MSDLKAFVGQYEFLEIFGQANMLVVPIWEIGRPRRDAGFSEGEEVDWRRRPVIAVHHNWTPSVSGRRRA
jgi:hypothetical protein